MISYLISFIISLIIIKLYFIYYDYSILSNKLTNIYQVKGNYPIIGHILSMINNPPWDTLSKWVLESKQSIIRFNLFGKHIIAINDRNMLKHILQNNFHIYQKDKFTYAPFSCILGTGLVTSEGELWKNQRTFIGPAFRVDILQDTAEISQRAVYRLCKKLESIRGKNIQIQIAEEFRKLTLQVITEAVLSIPPDECDIIFPKLYLPIVEEANRRTWYPFRAYLPLPATFKHLKAIKELNRYITNIIQTRRNEFINGNRKNDILDRILYNVKDEEWTQKLELQLRDEIKTFLFAGHETSSSMMTWTIYELLNNRKYLNNVLNESNELYGNNYSFYNSNTNSYNYIPFNNIKDGLEFTQASLKESLRKYSIVPVVTRQLIQDDNLCGYNIPKDTIIAIPIQAIHNNPKLWENPQEYNPNRFINKQIDPYSFLGFIAGPRNCIGQFFALMETKIVLSILLKQFTFRIPKENKGIKHKTQIPICPIDNMRLYVD